MFSEDDLKKAEKFIKFIAKAKLDVSVSDWLEFNRLLIWHNELMKKVGDSILEIKDVTHQPKVMKKSK